VGSNRVLAILILCFVPLSCHRNVPVAGSARPQPDPRIAEFVLKGDARFLDSHLYGWRQAEASYAKAYELSGGQEIRQKLLMTRILIQTREMDEDISDPGLDAGIEALCADPEDDRSRVLCALAHEYRETGAAPRNDKADALNTVIGKLVFDPARSASDAYLYTLYTRAYSLQEPKEVIDARLEQYKESPLFAYLRFEREGTRRLTELEAAFPQFAELFVLKAEELSQKTRFTGAKTYFTRAIELIPDYTRAINGLGNICLFFLEDYERALEFYEQSLRVDPTNTAGLFGKGAVLHHLGRYSESNAAMEAMLASDISRRGRAANSSVRYYTGEANYFEGYSYYLMRDRDNARERVDAAKNFIPNSEEANYLSGLLYFEGGEFDSARKDLLKATERGTYNCNAPYYLGRIYRVSNEAESEAEHPLPLADAPERLKNYLQRFPPAVEPPERKALNYFLGTCACFQTSVRDLLRQIDSIPDLDLEPAERALLKTRLEKKLTDNRLVATSIIDSMIQMVGADDVPGKETYLNLMNETLRRIRQ
jgi:tetratricopeptide (TPR) repeat protein